MMTFNNFFAVLFFSFSFAIVSAQNGQFNVRFEVADYDCTTQEMLVDIQVQAVDGKNFNISDQNYRFSYNREAVSAVNIAPVANGLNGIVTDADGNTSLFEAPSLQGSVDTVVSYNIILSGGNGYSIPTNEWTTVGRILLNITNNEACVNLKWHDQAPMNFPPTFIGERIGNTPAETAEGQYINLNACVADFCATTTITRPNVIEGNTTVFPNPVSTGTPINVKFDNNGFAKDATIIITDALGRVLFKQDVVMGLGATTTQINVDNLAAATYFVTVKGDNWNGGTEKFIKVAQ